MLEPTRSAPNTGLPESDRRGFLRGLAHLPLIGGGIAILGAPTRRAAVPVTRQLLLGGHRDGGQ